MFLVQATFVRSSSNLLCKRQATIFALKLFLLKVDVIVLSQISCGRKRFTAYRTDKRSFTRVHGSDVYQKLFRFCVLFITLLTWIRPFLIQVVLLQMFLIVVRSVKRFAAEMALIRWFAAVDSLMNSIVSICAKRFAAFVTFKRSQIGVSTNYVRL